MPTSDRVAIASVILRSVCLQYPQHTQQIKRIAKLIREKDAPSTSLLAAIHVWVGRDKMNSFLSLVEDKFVALKIQKRVMRSHGSFCHGCYSFPSELKCAECGNVAFCYGCLEYGPCEACCSRQHDAERDS